MPFADNGLIPDGVDVNTLPGALVAIVSILAVAGLIGFIAWVIFGRD